MKIFLIFLLAVSLLVFGCVSQQQSEQIKQAGQQEGQKNETQVQKTLNTTITPARDLTGSWSGSTAYQDNAANPNCKYEGKFDLNLQQQGNALQGVYQLTITKATKLLTTSLPCSQLGAYPPQQITGTVSTSIVQFTEGYATFIGVFTTDMINLNFESCPDGRCADGSAGVGSKGTVTLIRRS